MTKKIYVLGAGASVADGLPTMGSLIRDCFIFHFAGKIPSAAYSLIGDIQEPEILDKSCNVFRVMDAWYKTDLENKMQRYRNSGFVDGNLFYDANRYKEIIEPFFTKLYAIAFENEKDSQLTEKEAKNLYEDAKYFFYHPICSGQARGHNNYRKFVSVISRNPDSTIITFNYDLLLEKVLHKTLMKQNDLWSLPWNYCCTLNNKLQYKFDGPYKYLKMHGSFNWIYNRNNDVVELDDVYPKIDAIKKFYLSDKEIVLIPPKFKKEISMPCLKEVWSVAEKELSMADEIDFIGYSLPDADKDAIELFKNRTIQKLVIVDPVTSVREKISGILKFREKQYYNDFKSYLETNVQV
ncbi:MAG: hypothetical protein RBU23_07305 [Candidatus Auribacterota bacterium]|jgi:hypothetical protein|nr:hypothetical protein [Candidatus Auribacterota bacterium]